eukprot:TRINITY_DN2214_c0_g2_i2.p2 TRINITY_DN2214_c0_g2~~TRINITY_DN2214_c0_g2_i2.p2  ORF type:complete len:116 (-),score=12.54 TRINITY_DN2214_c0_g2_i2:163-510(-)
MPFSSERVEAGDESITESASGARLKYISLCCLNGFMVEKSSGEEKEQEEEDDAVLALKSLASRARRASASSRALSHCALWLITVHSLEGPSPPRQSTLGLWVTGSIPIFISFFFR